MQEENQPTLNKLNLKLYFSAILLICLIILPVHQLRSYFDFQQQYSNITSILAKGPTDEIPQMEINHLYLLLSRNPYKGSWYSSIKRSQYLNQQQGKIQIRSVFNSSNQLNSYDLKIRIFDGSYKDEKYFDISINSGSIKVQQRFEAGKILFQTISPLISYYHQGYGFKSSSEKSLYINKLKIKIFIVNYQATKDIRQLKIQILISSQYSINIFGKDIFIYNQTFHNFILAFLLICQFVIQLYGLHRIYQLIHSHKENIQRFSKFNFLIAFALDITEAIALTFVGFLNKVISPLSQKNIVVFSLPIALIWTIVLVIQLKMLIQFFRDHYHQSPIKFSLTIYGFFSFVCIFSYLQNFHPSYFLIMSAIAMLPQVYCNYMVGNKLKQSMKYFLMFILPKYLSIPYIRLYKYNVFEFSPNLTVSFVSFLLIILQTTLIMVQIKYGARSILPKFLHPQELKYFLSQPQSEDDNCAICLISLREKALKSQTQTQYNLDKSENQNEDIENNIVLTPCRHKFHIECLAQSMKTKSSCPICRSILPPLQDYD